MRSGSVVPLRVVEDAAIARELMKRGADYNGVYNPWVDLAKIAKGIKRNSRD